MRKIKNSDGSIMVFGDDTSPLDHEKYQWRYENGQDIDPSTPGAPIKIMQPTSRILDASAAQHEADLMRPEGVAPPPPRKYTGGTQIADATINLYPNSAQGAGHVGIQVDGDPSYGFYTKNGPDAGTLLGYEQPGQVRKDEISKLGGEVQSYKLDTTPEQDKIIREFVRKRLATPGGYDLYLRNCQDFVAEALRAAGIKLKPGAYPIQWFNINFAQPALNTKARRNQ